MPRQSNVLHYRQKDMKSILSFFHFLISSSKVQQNNADAFAQHETGLVQTLRRVIEAPAHSAGYGAQYIGGVSGLTENIRQTILKQLDSPIQNEEIGVFIPPQGADVFSNPEYHDSVLQCLKEIARGNHYNDVNSLAMKISRRRLAITNWEKGGLIGSGSFGSVYKGSNEKGSFFAVKEVSLSNKKSLGPLRNEISILTGLDHENIIQYYGTDKDGEMLYMFLELTKKTERDMLTSARGQSFIIGKGKVATLYTPTSVDLLVLLPDYADAFAQTGMVQTLRRVIEAAAPHSAGYVAQYIGGVSGFTANIVQTIRKKLGSPIQNEEIGGADVSSNPEYQDSVLQCLEEIARGNHYNDVNSLALKISRRRLAITNWEKGGLIGSGSFGSVYKGSNEKGSFFAVKEVSLSNKKSLGPLRNEISILTGLHHENIIQYYGTGEDKEKLYIFLELVSHGTLEQAYKNCPFKESQVSHYTRQILQGLKYLHGCNVIHRDLKCANIPVTEFRNIKLADFGLSKCMEDGKSLKPGLGSSFWMAPEVANPKSGGYDFPSDIWSLGCAVVEMSTGKYPQYHFRDVRALDRTIRMGTDLLFLILSHIL
ncbi:hypothetical protein H0E87_028656 [Populus deltoides]|uniref:mitogen-activated protein kinase kinase kinase n=1 Tax=Populus deltoides TaxID=3696 RepID=A0A8T2WTP1_POPDE|nr:hypothetical protein H0E87_028656 [Populus deltoides]